MQGATRRLWVEQNRHPGDRLALFSAIAEHTGQRPVLYPGSFVDVAASFTFDDVTYIDNDPRAQRFFDDPAGVDEIILENRPGTKAPRWSFLPGDYREVDPGRRFGLLVSLYAGFVSKACGRHLADDGWLFVNPSHGDAAMAALDESVELAAVVQRRGGRYRLSTENLDQYMVPKSGRAPTEDELMSSGRGVGYIRSAHAYLFRRTPISGQG